MLKLTQGQGYARGCLYANAEKTMAMLACIGVLLGLSGCGPDEKQRAQWAEEKRIECLDKVCQGDIEPKRDQLREVVFKLNGQWYLMPKEYGNPSFGAISFYWPSKAASGNPEAVRRAPEVVINPNGSVGNFYDVAVEIFFTSRARWPPSKVEKPWERSNWERRFAEIRSEGLRMERSTVSSSLDVVRFYQADGKPYRTTYYVATQQKRVRGESLVVAACDSDITHKDARCTSAEFWQEDVLVDFRFHAKHAMDWPAIHQEIVRVMNLLKKVQP